MTTSASIKCGSTRKELDISDGLKNGSLKHDDEFVEIPDHLLLPCNKNDSPAMGSKPFCYIFSEEGMAWLEPRLVFIQGQRDEDWHYQ